MTAGSAGRKPLNVTCSLIRVSKDRARKDLGDLSELAESMRTLGLLQPILVRPDGPGWEVVAGHRRLAAAQSLGWDQIFCVSATDLGDAVAALRAERDENTCRKDFTPSEAVALGLRLEELERPKAKERMSEGGKGAQVAQPSRVTETVAPAVGMKPRSYEKARQVVKTANDPDETPEVREAAAEAVAEMDATGKVDGPYRKVQAAREQQTVADRAAEAVAEFPFLAPDQSPGLPPEEIVAVADDIRSEPPEDRERAIEAAKTWHKVYDSNPGPDPLKLIHNAVKSVEHAAACRRILADLDADNLAEVIEGLSLDYRLNLERRIRDAVWQCQVLAEAIRPAESPNLRSVK